MAHSNINVNLNGSGRQTPLLLGCGKGRVSVVWVLLKDPRVDVTLEDEYRRTPLWWTCYMGSMKSLSGLLQVAEIWGMSRTRKGALGVWTKKPPLTLQGGGATRKLCLCLKDSLPTQYRHAMSFVWSWECQMRWLQMSLPWPFSCGTIFFNPHQLPSLLPLPIMLLLLLPLLLLLTPDSLPWPQGCPWSCRCSFAVVQLDRWNRIFFSWIQKPPSNHLPGCFCFLFIQNEQLKNPLWSWSMLFFECLWLGNLCLPPTFIIIIVIYFSSHPSSVDRLWFIQNYWRCNYWNIWIFEFESFSTFLLFIFFFLFFPLPILPQKPLQNFPIFSISICFSISLLNFVINLIQFL